MIPVCARFELFPEIMMIRCITWQLIGIAWWVFRAICAINREECLQNGTYFFFLFWKKDCFCNYGRVLCRHWVRSDPDILLFNHETGLRKLLGNLGYNTILLYCKSGQTWTENSLRSQCNTTFIARQSSCVQCTNKKMFGNRSSKMGV